MRAQAACGCETPATQGGRGGGGHSLAVLAPAWRWRLLCILIGAMDQLEQMGAACAAGARGCCARSRDVANRKRGLRRSQREPREWLRIALSGGLSCIRGGLLPPPPTQVHFSAIPPMEPSCVRLRCVICRPLGCTQSLMPLGLTFPGKRAANNRAIAHWGSGGTTCGPGGDIEQHAVGWDAAMPSNPAASHRACTHSSTTGWCQYSPCGAVMRAEMCARKLKTAVLYSMAGSGPTRPTASAPLAPIRTTHVPRARRKQVASCVTGAASRPRPAGWAPAAAAPAAAPARPPAPALPPAGGAGPGADSHSLSPVHCAA